MTLMIAGEVRRLLLAEVRTHGSQAALAQRMGVDRSFVSNVINGRKAPSRRVLDYLGLVRVVGYQLRGPM